jgi:DNA polymerase-3 subunit chi
VTEIAFHFNAPDKLGYACRLLRKAYGAAAKVVVVGEPAALASLNDSLWTFSAVDFIPHSYGQDAATTALSPVLLAETAVGAPHAQILVNLGGGVPAGFERFERLIEVVTQDDEDRQGARSRWKHYADRGYAIVRHDLALKG